jgi:hypothetical protein
MITTITAAILRDQTAAAIPLVRITATIRLARVLDPEMTVVQALAPMIIPEVVTIITMAANRRMESKNAPLIIEVTLKTEDMRGLFILLNEPRI